MKSKAPYLLLLVPFVWAVGFGLMLSDGIKKKERERLEMLEACCCCAK